MIISKKQQRVSGIFAIMAFNLLISACDNTAETANSRQFGQTPVHRVEIVTVENKAVSLTQTVSGTLEPVTKIRLYNEESGRILLLPRSEGDFVKKGTLLIQLDNELLKIDVSKAKASREQAKLDLSRLKKLLPKKISTEEEVARARTVLNLAVADEKLLVTRLQRTTIKAPIDGVISKRLYEPGDMLAPQSHIHTIIDPTALLLKASLAERWISLVKDNQAVTLHIDALGDRRIEAKVLRIHPTINAGTHKGLVEILLDPQPEGATVGQFARADIKLTATHRLVIPTHTIHFEPKGAYVYRIIEKEGSTVAEKIHFQQGQQFDSLTEIFSGLAPGDKIVNRGYLGLRDGKKVTIAEPSVR